MQHFSADTEASLPIPLWLLLMPHALWLLLLLLLLLIHRARTSTSVTTTAAVGQQPGMMRVVEAGQQQAMAAT
jgi:hypothetical protein